jgi:translation initiation factor IF-3
MDLVEVAPGSSPPVCRIMDYGRYKYMQAKKTQEARRKSAQVSLKEVKIRPKTEEHDLNVKLRKAREFLEAGNRLKVSMMFRGREMAYTDRGRELLVQFAEQLDDLGQVEMMPRQEGRNMFLVMSPKTSG